MSTHRLGAPITNGAPSDVSDIGQDCVQIAIDAPREISILRSELAEAAKVNQESAKADRESIKNLKNMLKNQKDKTNT